MRKVLSILAGLIAATVLVMSVFGHELREQMAYRVGATLPASGAVGEIFVLVAEGTSPDSTVYVRDPLLGWETVGASGGLDSLTDVVITAAADGDFLFYNGSNWVDQTTAQVQTQLGLNGTLNAVAKFNATDVTPSSITDDGTTVDFTVADFTVIDAATFTSDAGVGFIFNAPDTDDQNIFQARNSGGTNGLLIDSQPGAGFGGNLWAFNEALNAMNGVEDTINGINIAITNANHTGGTLNAINVAAITGDAQATENGITVAAGYDYGINLTAFAADNTIPPIYLADAARVRWNGAAVIQTNVGYAFRIIDADGNIMFSRLSDTTSSVGGHRIGTAVAVVGADQAITAPANVFHASAGAAASVATIVDPTDAMAAQITVICNDANLTFTNTDAGGANTLDLVASFVCSIHDTLSMVYDVTNDRWLEVARSVN